MHWTSLQLVQLALVAGYNRAADCRGRRLPGSVVADEGTCLDGGEKELIENVNHLKRLLVSSIESYRTFC